MSAPPHAPVVRRARTGDVAVLAGIHDAARHGDQGRLDEPPVPKTGPAPARETIASFVEAGWSYVAEVGDEVVGYLLAQPIAFVEATPLTVWVEEVAVHPDHRRRGVATALYRALGDAARAAGAKAVLTRLDRDDAAALALHRRVGFQVHPTETVVWRLEPG